MSTWCYYNEIDPYCCQWLRNLIKAKLICDGCVDERSIELVEPNDLRGYNQCHFFAGIAGWSYALQLAGWPDDRAIWTGSCPCQPFSIAGQRKGFSDERDLWPKWFPLIRDRRPARIIGEQVASSDGRKWLTRVFVNLETLGYRTGGADLCAAGVGAPHIRQRLWWLADAGCERGPGWRGPGVMAGPAREVENAQEERQRVRDAVDNGCSDGGMAESERSERRKHAQYRADDLNEVEVRSQGSGGPGECGEPSPQEMDNPTTGFWSDFTLIPCLDGKARRIEPGTFPLAHGVSGRLVARGSLQQAEAEVQEPHWYNRIGALRTFGNAIVPQVAAEVLKAWMEVRP